MAARTKVTEIVALAEKALIDAVEEGDGFPEIDRELLKSLKSGYSDEDRAELLNKFHHAIENCTQCKLHTGRTKFVFGTGNPNADILFVGEGPGKEEDLTGEPFVGRAGKLLDKILDAIKLDRTMIYIANIVKCRPPNNRDPETDEMATCMPYLLKQIELIRPKLICCLGRVSAQALLETTKPLGKLRGEFHDFRGVKLCVTYHPAALLRNPQFKRGTWEDVKMLRREYDRLRGVESEF